MFNNSYVYIIKDKKKGFYKIGKSNNFFRRFLQIVGFLTFLKIDYKDSFYIKCKTEQEALELESALHQLFRNKHINPNNIPYHDGRTEWFNLNKNDIENLKILLKKEINRKVKKIGYIKYVLHFFIRKRTIFNLVY